MTSSNAGVASHTFRSKLVDEGSRIPEVMAVRREIKRQDRAFVARPPLGPGKSPQLGCVGSRPSWGIRFGLCTSNSWAMSGSADTDHWGLHPP
jgi:hypothetical protein